MWSRKHLVINKASNLEIDGLQKQTTPGSTPDENHPDWTIKDLGKWLTFSSLHLFSFSLSVTKNECQRLIVAEGRGWSSAAKAHPPQDLWVCAF